MSVSDECRWFKRTSHNCVSSVNDFDVAALSPVISFD